jgi:hypothetical protein
MAGGCACCPARHRRDGDGCSRPHPPVDRDCHLPYPAAITACPERATLQQTGPASATPTGAACVECSRVTSRRWTDPAGRSLPWCAGELPAPTPKVTVPQQPTRSTPAAAPPAKPVPLRSRTGRKQRAVVTVRLADPTSDPHDNDTDARSHDVTDPAELETAADDKETLW